MLIIPDNDEIVFPLDPGVYFTSGLSDVAAIIATDAELVCKLSSEDCDAVWYKDGQEVSRGHDGAAST